MASVQHLRFQILGILCIAVLNGSFGSVSSQRSTMRSGYGEPCNKTLKCRSQSWFGCDVESGTCLCVKAEEMVYDMNKSKCVALIGERCKFGFEEETVSSWYEKAECVLGGICSPSGSCSCPPGTYEGTEQEACYPVKGYGESCSSKVECNMEKFLSCSDGICGCDPDAAIYSSTSYTAYYANVNYHSRTESVTAGAGVCVGRVGTSCSSQARKYCVRNAMCNRESICECRPSFSTTSELLCGLGYDQPCSSGSLSLEYSGDVCSDQYRCSGKSADQRNSHQKTNSKCSCSNPAYQEFDSTTMTCRGRVGSPCDPTQENSCTFRSSCVERDSVFQCECDDGYIVNESWKCQKGFGSSCDYYDGGRVANEEICDEVPSLECISGKCSCRNSVDIYEEEKRQCSVPVGLACRESSECVTNSACQENPGGKKFPGRCVCQQGFQMRRNQTCEVAVVGLETAERSLEEDVEIDV